MTKRLATSPWQQQAANAALSRQARETARAGEHLLPVQHNMHRRCLVHDYSNPGYYHITLRTENAVDQPLGRVIGCDADTAKVVLTPVGQMVQYELLHSITTHYPMVEVQDYVIMPEHMHFILNVHSQLQSKDGKVQTLGRVIAGFKYGCTRRWLEMQESNQPTETVGAPGAAFGALPSRRNDSDGAFGALRFCRKDSVGALRSRRKDSVGAFGALPSRRKDSVGAFGALRFGRKESKEESLFEKGYTDVMPLHAGQLATQRAYIKDNPRMRWLRMSNRSWLSPNRSGIDTALTTGALRTYLRRECRPNQATEAILEGIESQLLLDGAPGALRFSGNDSDGASRFSGNDSDGASRFDGNDSDGALRFGGKDSPAHGASRFIRKDSPAHGALRLGRKDIITCHTYGNRALLDRNQHRLLPLVCHRADKAMLQEQRLAFLEAAKQGAIAVSACINPDENTLFKELIAAGYPVIKVEDNGFPEVYHPSEERQILCAEGKLLIVTPWQYEYRKETDTLEVAFCKTMNCLAQALCRTKDSWWKDEKKE